jgi:hypothetical protein
LVAFPVEFTAEGGEVTAVLTDFKAELRCSGSSGKGQITGPRSTTSSYVFTACEAGGGICQSASANPGEIRTPPIAADLVFLSQGRHEVGMLLAPDGDTYMTFECGGESVSALGPFLSPVGPINQEATSFTASLRRLGAVQIPDEYEGSSGERLQAIPTAEREGGLQPGTTGVELSFAIHTSAPLTVKAVSAAEVEARQREEEAAAKKRHDDEEAAKAAAAKKHQEEEDAAKAAAEQKREQERAQAKKRAQQRSKALEQCRKGHSKQRRARCEARVKKRFAVPHPNRRY